MSNVYITEPPTSAKVLLKTTVGDIDIELWAKEIPKACRNFIQLCMEGYYNNTVFHRLVKGFIVQGGDPKGDGTGGESIYGETFKDEFHSRLRFSRRGIVAMANAGKDDNGSQFFFTLAATPELQNVHTIFGKVTGETIFNMLKLEDGLVEHERPVYPHKILKTEVLSNPFPDIEPRILEKPEDKVEKKKKDRKPGVKNFKLLSFGAEAEEDEEETSVANQEFVGKGKSTHDLLDDPKLSTKPVVEPAVETKKDSEESSDEESEEDEIDHEQELANIKNKLKSDKRKPSSSYYLNKDEKEARKRKAEEIREEIIKIKKEYKKNKLTQEVAKEEEVKKKEQSETFKAYQEEFDKYKDKKQLLPKKGKTREDFTLNMLANFKKKLESAKDKMEEESEDAEEKEKEKKIEKNDDSDPEDTSWMAHKLRFASNEEVLARDANTKGDDWYEVYDPRNPLNKRRREESKKNLIHKVGHKR